MNLDIEHKPSSDSHNGRTARMAELTRPVTGVRTSGGNWAIVGQNVLQSEHLEFGPTVDAYNSPVTEVPRGVYGTVTWRHYGDSVADSHFVIQIAAKDLESHEDSSLRSE